MPSGGDYHGGDKNIDQQRYRQYLDELDALFSAESTASAPPASNDGK